MADGQQAIDDAIKRCNFLRNFLRKRASVQIWSESERSTVKATCLAWFHTQRGLAAAQVDSAALAEVDSRYNELLLATGHAASRSVYQRLLKDIKKELLALRSKYIRASINTSADKASDRPPSFAPLIPDPKMQAILERRWNECVTCLSCGAPLAMTVMMGGLLEGLLLARANREPNLKSVFTASTAPKTKRVVIRFHSRNGC